MREFVRRDPELPRVNANAETRELAAEARRMPGPRARLQLRDRGRAGRIVDVPVRLLSAKPSETRDLRTVRLALLEALLSEEVGDQIVVEPGGLDADILGPAPEEASTPAVVQHPRPRSCERGRHLTARVRRR